MPDARYRISSGKLDTHSKLRAVTVFFLVLLCIALGGYIYCLKVIQNDACSSLECLDAAANIITSIDQNADPCEDFYRYACGNFVNRINKKITTDNQIRVLCKQSSDNIEWNPLELQKQYYHSCLDVEAIDNDGYHKIIEIIEQFGGWPVLKGTNWRHFNIEEAYHTSWTLGLPSEIFLHLNITPDSDNMEIGYPNVTPNLSDRFVENIYFDLMVETAVNFGSSRMIAEKDLSYTLDFEKMLLKIIRKSNVSENYIEVSKEDLNIAIRQINIARMVENTTLADLDSFSSIKANKLFLEELNLLLAGTSTRTKANFYVWKIIQYFGHYLPSHLRINFVNFDTMMRRQYDNAGSRSDFCLKESISRFPNVMQKTLTDRQISKENLKDINDIINFLKRAYISRIDSSEWIDKETKEKITTKVNKMSFNIGYIQDVEWDSYLENFNFTSNNIIDMIMDINIYNRNFFQDLNSTDIWDKLENVENMLYLPNQNYIFVPISVLQDKFYGKHRPNYLSYGDLGISLAHLMAHSLSEDASIYVEEGITVDENEKMLWNNYTWHQLFSRITCVNNQFLNETKDLEDSVENVCDTIGIDVAYEAYIAWLTQNGEEQQLPGTPHTPNQLFWLQFAMQYCSTDIENIDENKGGNLHDTNKHRSLSILRNSVYFAKDFNCSSGTTMNPNDKCYIF